MRGTPFAAAAPDIVFDGGGFDTPEGGWYLYTDGVLTDTVHTGDPMELRWDGKTLRYGAANGCGTGFSNGVKVTVNRLPDPTVTVLRGGEALEGTTGCHGVEYGLEVSSSGGHGYEWSGGLGTDNAVSLGLLDEGDYTYSVTATDLDEETGCSNTAEVSFHVSRTVFDTAVTVCAADLPYDFYGETVEAEGEYTYMHTAADGCDSVVVLTLRVNRPQVLRTAAYICNGQTYEWEHRPGLVYGAGLTDTVLTDTVRVAASALSSDVTGQACDSVIYALHLSISDEVFLELPQGDEFTVAPGQELTLEANVRGRGCGEVNDKLAVAYRLYKDGEPVEHVNSHGRVSIGTYLPVLNTSFGTEIVEGAGEIPGSTFTIQYYDYNYFYSDFFRQVDNRITAVLDEPGDYRLALAVTRKATASGQDYPMTYHHNATDMVVMGGANAEPTDTVFSDTVNVYIHVDAELEAEETPATAAYDGFLDIDTVTYTAEVSGTSSFELRVLPNTDNGERKLSVDYVVRRNGEEVPTVGAYGSLHLSTDVPERNRTFGAALTAGTGSAPANTFAIAYYTYDFFYSHFLESTRSRFTARWDEPGDYEVTFTLRERSAGQEIPFTYDAASTRYIGGHGSAAGAAVSTETLRFHVAADTALVELEETVCADDLPFVYNGREYTGSVRDTFGDAQHVHDTVLVLHLTVRELAEHEFSDAACDSYDWNGETYTESGDYTQRFAGANGCDSVVTLHLTVVKAPAIRITADDTVCENANVRVTVTVSHPAGIDNTTGAATAADPDFALEETTRDTVNGTVYVRYTGTLAHLAGDAVVEVTGTNTTAVNSGVSCTGTAEARITVVPGDSVAHFTAEVCQGEAYSDNNGFSVGADRTAEPGVVHDTIVTGSSDCGTYRAALALTVKPVYSGDHAVVIEDDVCEGHPYQGHGFDLTAEEIAAATEFSDTVPTAGGCDSVTVLRLTVLPTVRDEFTVETCDGSYTWNQETYGESGDYAQTFQAYNGCDSVVTLHLTLFESAAADTTAVACNSFTWHGETYTSTPATDPQHNYRTVNGCDSVVTLHLTVKHSTYGSMTAEACSSYTWTGGTGETYTVSGTYPYEYTNDEGCPSVDTLHLTVNMPAAVSLDSTVTAAQLPLEWNGVVFTGTGSNTVVLQTGNGCDSTVAMNVTVSDVTGDDPFMTVHLNGTGDTAVLMAFANGQPMTDTVSIDYRLYRDGVPVTDVEYECGGHLYIGTELHGDLYGSELSEASGNVPGNTFAIANYHYEYFYWAFLNGRRNTVTHSFTQEGVYRVEFDLVRESGGQDFPLPYDDDYTHHIGGKNSLPAAGVLASAVVEFRVQAGGATGGTEQGTGLTMSLSSETTDGTEAVTMTFDVSDGHEAEKAAVRYTVYAGDGGEALPLLSGVGSVRIATGYGAGDEYGGTLTEGTGYVPEATFHPMSYDYNYFNAGYLAGAHNTVSASFTLPGTYRIKFELVQMTGGQELPLTYGSEFRRIGGKLAEATNRVYDTKWLTCTAGGTSQNPVTTGIGDNEGDGDGFVLYPNPARDRAVLSLGGVSEGATLVVTDVNGREVYRTNVSGRRMELNVGTWTEGVYFVTLRDQSRTVTRKLVVTR